MAQNHPVYVYSHDCTDFTTTGIVGDLKPIEAVFTEEKNGVSEIVMRLTYDEYGKWKAARKGNIIKCEVPVRTPPVISDDEYANTTTVYE